VEAMGRCEDDKSRQMDVWEDNVSMVLLTGGQLETGLYDIANIERVKKRVMTYHWSEDTQFFQNLVVRRPAEQKMLNEKIHEEFGDFGEMRTLGEAKKRFFWHDKTEFVKKFIKVCEKCQLARQSRKMRSGIEKMKSIHICFIML
jgi:hypothetical protein